MKLAPYIACICEGSAETAIIDVLVDNNLLIFTREDMLEENVIRCRSAKTFEERFLRKGFKDQISVIRILDSRREEFRLSKAYEKKGLKFTYKINGWKPHPERTNQSTGSESWNRSGNVRFKRRQLGGRDGH